jgi:hypothetical protein
LHFTQRTLKFGVLKYSFEVVWNGTIKFFATFVKSSEAANKFSINFNGVITSGKDKSKLAINYDLINFPMKLKL